MEHRQQLQHKKYHAFISYRHADNKEQGRQWATWLHQALETYEVPKDLVGKKNSHGDTIPERIYPIFRDEEELPAHADLGKTIVGALEQTHLLVVLCSPRSVDSTYVADEIDYFKKLGHSDRIIAAMIDGEPNASWDEGKHKLGFSKEDECFPIPLQFEYDKEGNRTDKHAEPIAADFRITTDGKSEQGWTSPVAYREYLKAHTNLDNRAISVKTEAYQKQLELMLLKIVAGILGVPLGELTQRDKVYQLEQERLKAKRLRLWLALVAMLAILAIGAGVLAYIKQQQAVKEQQHSILKAADSSVLNGHLLTRDKKYRQAKQVLRYAHNTYKDSGASPIAANIQYTLTAGRVVESLNEYRFDSAVTALIPYTDTQALVGTSSGNVYLYDYVTNGTPKKLFNGKAEVKSLQLFADNKRLLILCASRVTVFDLELKRAIIDDNDYAGFEHQFAHILSKKNQLIVISHYLNPKQKTPKTDTVFSIIDLDARKVIATYANEGETYASALSPNEDLLLIGQIDMAYEIQLESFELSRKYSGGIGANGHALMFKHAISSAIYSEDGDYIALGCSDGVIEVWQRTSSEPFYFQRFIDSQGIKAIRFIESPPFFDAVFAGNNGSVQQFSGLSQDILYAHEDEVSALIYGNNSFPYLLSASKTGKVKFSSLNKRGAQFGVQSGSFAPPSLEYSKDGRILLFSDLLGEEVTLLDSDTGSLLLSMGIDSEVLGASFADEPGFIWVLTQNQLQKWDIIRQEQVYKQDISSRGFARLHVSNDKKHLIVSNTNDSKKDKSGRQLKSCVDLYTVPDGALLSDSILDKETVFEMIGGNLVTAMSYDASVIATATDHGEIFIADRESSSFSRIKRRLGSRIDALALTSTGQQLAVGYVDGVIEIYDRNTGSWGHKMRGHEMGIADLEISEDNRWLISAGREGSVRVWDIELGNQTINLGNNPISTLAIHNSGRIARAVMGDREYYGDNDLYLVNGNRAELMLRQERDTSYRSDLKPLFNWYVLNQKLSLANHVKQEAEAKGIRLDVASLAQFEQQQGQYADAIQLYREAAKESSDANAKIFYGLKAESFFTPEKFIQALRADDEQGVKSMLALGLDPNMIDNYSSTTPLGIAVSRNNYAMAQLILENGGDPNYLGTRKETALFEAVGKPRLWRLLLDKGVDIHQLNISKRHILHRAAFRGDKALILELIGRGVDIGVKDIDGKTPYNMAVSGRRTYPELGDELWDEIEQLLSQKK